ncbi:SatD family protein, partial [Streptococcus suis]
MNYIAIIGDIVNSKQTSNRSSIQERLKQQLNRINH